MVRRLLVEEAPDVVAVVLLGPLAPMTVFILGGSERQRRLLVPFGHEHESRWWVDAFAISPYELRSSISQAWSSTCQAMRRAA